LLLLFVFLGDAIGWPGRRGATTITLAHITFGLAFATVVILYVAFRVAGPSAGQFL